MTPQPMLTVGDRLPPFELQAVVSREPGLEFATITEHSFPGKWLVLFLWPMDFTFVCPTEIAEFGRRNDAFVAHDAQVLGASVDSRYVHLAWRDQNDTIRELPFPMLADVKHQLAGALGVLHEQDGVALRATFIVDPNGVIRWACANDSTSDGAPTRCCGPSPPYRPRSSRPATGTRVSPRCARGGRLGGRDERLLDARDHRGRVSQRIAGLGLRTRVRPESTEVIVGHAYLPYRHA